MTDQACGERLGGRLFRPDFVASDLDGTLLPPSLEFTPATLEGVTALHAAGIPFALCTGRMLQSARRMAARLGIVTGPIICYQGALVADLSSGDWILHRPLPAGLAVEVVEHLRVLKRHVNVYIDDELYVEELDDWARRYAEYAEVGCTVVDDLAALVNASPPTKMVITTDPDDVTAILPGLQERWRDRLYVTRSLPNYIEVNHPDATKSAALDFLCRRMGWRRERVVACGDGLNDVDMLIWAGLGVAMSEAGAEVRAAADCVVPRAELGDLFVQLAEAGV